jgi:hypothetical protein
MSKYSTKRYLITENQYRSLLKPASTKHSSIKLNHPNLEKANNDKAEMDFSLSNPTSSDFDKVLNYTTNLANYLQNISKGLTISKSKAILGSKAKQPKQPPPQINNPIATQTPPPPIPPTITPPAQPQDALPQVTPRNALFQSPTFLTPQATPQAMTPYPHQQVDTYSTPRSQATKKRPKKRNNANDQDPQIQNSAEIPNPNTTAQKRRAQRYSTSRLLRDMDSVEQQVVGSQLDKLLDTGLFRWNDNTGSIFLNNKKLPNAHIFSLAEDLKANKRHFSQGADYDKIYTLLEQ